MSAHHIRAEVGPKGMAVRHLKVGYASWLERRDSSVPIRRGRWRTEGLPGTRVTGVDASLVFGLSCHGTAQQLNAEETSAERI